MKFSLLKNLIQERLPVYWDDKGVYFHPGPSDPDQPNGFVVVLSVDGGLGLQLDGVLDNWGWQVKTMGDQNLYDDAETLAHDIDKILMSWVSGKQDGVHVASIVRVGGPPQHLEFDSAERTAFVCSYLFDVESGLQPI